MLLPYSSKNLTCIVALAVVVWKNAYFKLPFLNTIPTFPGKRVAQYQKKKKRTAKMLRYKEKKF